MRAIDLLGGSTIVSESDCWDMLGTQSVGRVAFSLDGQIEIFPVNYGLDGDGVIFRTNVGRKFTGARLADVAFEVDRIDPESRCGWSVVIHGTARDITRFDSPERQVAVQPWTGTKDFLIRITPRSITGRRVARLT
jgi:nitroimidazol reductase NimA-like FMN-containing flavoprotein (pyridoxamine 5'-phosphate oxidase superfamily)